jgi:zinc protease
MSLKELTMPRRFAPLVGACLLLLTYANELRAKEPGVTKIETIEGITEYRLENGLQVLLYPDASKPTVTVNLTVFVGSRQEGYGETGMAHLLEHMLFKGTPEHPLIPKALQERGARFNGTTWVDRTNYYETLPAKDDNLEFALRLEADRMVNSYVKQSDLISEMTVVRNEFERGENSPSNLLSQHLMAAAYEWHNYGKSTIGNRSDIERVPIQNLQAFYRKHYQPDNCMLVVAGKFDEAQTIGFIVKYFGSIPKPARKLETTYTEEPPQDGERSVTLRRVGDLGIVGAVYHVPAGAHPDVPKLEVLANALDNPPSGRLYKALVEARKASSVAANVTSWHDPGVFELEAEVQKQDSLDVARDTLLEIAEKVGSEGISDEEVARAKRQILKKRELAAADTSSIAVELSNWASQGDWRLYFLHRDQVEKVTAKDVQEVAARYLMLTNRTVGMFIPTEKTERATIPPTPDLAKLFAGYHGREESAQGEAFDVSPANIEARSKESTLPEHVKVIALPKKTRGEAVHVRLIVRYGSPESLKGYEIAADFLPAMLTRGTKQLTRQQIQDALDELEATLTPSGDTGSATLSIETKKSRLPAVLSLVKQLLREPSFPADEFEVYRRQQMAGLEEQLTDPQSLAIVQVRRTVSPYPKDDVRYITTISEDIERVKKVTLDDVKKLYNDFLSSQEVEVALVGDLDVEENLAVLREAFADWKTEHRFERIPHVAFPEVKGSTTEVATPDKPNAVYIAGLVFPMRDDDPDYAAIVLGNYVFGGGSLSSRLGDRVRQKDGLSYGVGSFISADSFNERTSLTIFAICNPQNIKKVDGAIREEFDRLLADGITADELERAKRGYLQQQQVSRTRDASLCGVLADNLYVGRTMKYYDELEKKIQGLTREEILAALKEHFDPNRLVIVMAGDFKQSGGEK